MVISQPPGNNPSYYYQCFTNAASIALNASRDTLCSIHAINIRATQKWCCCYIFYMNQIHGGITADCSLFILSLHALALHLAVKILSNLSVWRFEHVDSHIYICRLHFPPECQQDRTLCKPILLRKNIPNIWHKSSTKHKEVRPDWNDKNDNANYAPSYHMEGFTNGSGCHF